MASPRWAAYAAGCDAQLEMPITRFDPELQPVVWWMAMPWMGYHEVRVVGCRACKEWIEMMGFDHVVSFNHCLSMFAPNLTLRSHKLFLTIGNGTPHALFVERATTSRKRLDHVWVLNLPIWSRVMTSIVVGNPLGHVSSIWCVRRSTSRVVSCHSFHRMPQTQWLHTTSPCQHGQRRRGWSCWIFMDFFVKILRS